MDSLRSLLLIDDDTSFLTTMKYDFKNVYRIITAQNIADGLKILETKDVDLILLDVDLDNENGLEGIQRIKKACPSSCIAMLSGHSDVEFVVSAIKAGALDYLTKPVDRNQLTAVVEKAVASRKIQDKCETMLHTQFMSNGKDINIIYKSEKMRKLMALAEQVKHHDVNILIKGETGTGKELLARYVHNMSGNRKRPFIAVNCAAIPEHLLESELFGHEMGAFTGASRRRIGKFELADGGDIFLDEISTMKIDLQVKLLRVLQEKEFTRLGSNTPIKADFRVISACNQPLEKMIEQNSFRMDLYHRMRVVELELPPLRERPEDIPVIADYYARKFNKKAELSQLFTDNAMKKLQAYPWPGNIRELSNVVQSMIITCANKVIDEASFPPWVLDGCVSGKTAEKANDNIVPFFTKSEPVRPLKDFIQQTEREYIKHVLRTFEDDKLKTADKLGISRATLYSKLKELGIG